MRFFQGLIGIIIGVLLLKYTFNLVNFLGKFDWAEKYFSGGLGGTYFFYKVAGIVVIVFSALYMFGLLDNLVAPFANIFSGLKRK